MNSLYLRAKLNFSDFLHVCAAWLTFTDLVTNSYIK